MSNAFLSTNTAAIEEGKLKLAIRDGVELEKAVWFLLCNGIIIYDTF